MFTFDVYKKEIQKHYKNAIIKDNTGILAQPTPAQLRDYCKIILNERLTPIDEQNFIDFFEAVDRISLSKAIDKCNNDKFKTIISFLKETRDSNINLRVEIAAILVNYPHRPYSKFRRLETLESISQKTYAKSSQSFEHSIINTPIQTLNQATLPTALNSMKHKLSNWIMGSVAVVGLGIGIQKTLEQKCMMWKNDHYEKVDCDCQPQAMYSSNTIKPIDKSVFGLKKIETCDTTTFFDRYNNPLVWYHKMNNTIECFNQDAKHPVTGKDLKPITKYMIKTHQLDK